MNMVSIQYYEICQRTIALLSEAISVYGVLLWYGLYVCLHGE